MNTPTTYIVHYLSHQPDGLAWQRAAYTDAVEAHAERERFSKKGLATYLEVNLARS